jgi:hypothetical protein
MSLAPRTSNNGLPIVKYSPRNNLNTVSGGTSSMNLGALRRARNNLSKTNRSKRNKLIAFLVFSALCFALVYYIGSTAAAGTESVKILLTRLIGNGTKALDSAIRILRVMKNIPQPVVNATAGALSTIPGSLIGGNSKRVTALKSVVAAAALVGVGMKFQRGDDALHVLEALKGVANKAQKTTGWFGWLNTGGGRLATHAFAGKSTLDLYYILAKTIMKYAIQVGGVIGVSALSAIKAYKNRVELPNNLRALGNISQSAQRRIMMDAVNKLLRGVKNNNNNNRRPATAGVNVTRNNAVLGFPVTRRVRRRPNSAR